MIHLHGLHAVDHNIDVVLNRGEIAYLLDALDVFQTLLDLELDSANNLRLKLERYLQT